MSKAKIYTVLPDEIKEGFPHGQWLFDTPGLVLNFWTPVSSDEAHMPDLEPMIKQFAAFMSSDELYMPFESPHTPGINYLHRNAAGRIMSTNPAWSRKVYARTQNGGPMLVDNDSNLPILRKLRN